MTLGGLIKNFRTAHGYSMDVFSKMSGLSKGYISMLESGKHPRTGQPIKPTIQTFKACANAMNIPLNRLISSVDSGQAITVNQISPESPNAIVLPNKQIHMIPVFESVSAGLGVTADPRVIDYMPLYIECPSEAAETMCVRVVGNSMYPKIEDGDIIQIRKQTSVDSGDVAALLIDDDEAVVKRVVYGADWIELQSFNPEYAPRRFEGADVQRVQVMGLVRRVIKTLK